RDVLRPAPWIRSMAELAVNLEDISVSISDIERNAKGIPVLIRQYLKTGGQLLGFNVDPDFSDVLDALILTDLRTVDAAILDRCMGRSGAAAFREWHSARRVLAGSPAA